jgi:hypothetical protein
VYTEEDRAMAVDHSVDVDRWCEGFEQVIRRVGARFGRVEPRRRAGPVRAGAGGQAGQHDVVVDCRACQ